MKVLISAKFEDYILNKYLLLDNDFLSELFRNEYLNEEFISKAYKSFLIVDKLTEFEFLRDLYLPQEQSDWNVFLNKGQFSILSFTSPISIKILENALLLSRIYKHNSNGDRRKASYADLSLAARVMLNKTLLITGNKVDFPNCIFNVLGIISAEQKDGIFKNFYLIEFDESKFNKTYSEYEIMQTKSCVKL